MTIAVHPAAAPAARIAAGTHPGAVVLAVRDRAGLAAWYGRVIGLVPVFETGTSTVLGAADGRPLVVLTERADLPEADPRRAGLFHMAILLPSRDDLARWVAHVAAAGIAIEGASDHLVSEAFYLSDPEGNGIEVYRDRRRDEWPREAGRLKMATLPADVQGILAAGRALPAHAGAPAGTTMGHVHLKVADLDASRRFYVEGLGLDLMVEYPGALFVAADGYHHHLGLNVWQSRGRPHGAAPTLGLAAAMLILPGPAAVTATTARLEAAGHASSAVTGGAAAIDPAGNRILLLEAEPAAADLAALAG